MAGGAALVANAAEDLGKVSGKVRSWWNRWSEPANDQDDIELGAGPIHPQEQERERDLAILNERVQLLKKTNEDLKRKIRSLKAENKRWQRGENGEGKENEKEKEKENEKQVTGFFSTPRTLSDDEFSYG